MNEKITELLERCRSNGMKIWTEGGKLRYKSGEEFLKSGILSELKENKAEIIAYLENERKEPSMVTDPEGRFQPFLLSDVQSAYVLGRNENFSYGGVACHNYMELEYDRLDGKKAEEVFRRLIARHDMLRAVMYEDGSQQVLAEVPDFSIRVYGDDADSSEIEKLRDEMSRKVYPLGKAPMFSAAISHQGDKSILHFSIEFLIADWTSVWTILSEFESLYFEPEKELSDIGVSFRDYLLTEKRSANSKKAEADKEYWLAKAENFPSAPKIPINKEADAEKCFMRKTIDLAPEKWDSLKAKANSAGVTPTALVMAIYGEVLRKWSMKKDIALNMTVLSRKPVHEDIFKVVGDFTTLALIEMRSGGKNQTFTERLKETNKAIFSSLDHSEFSGVEMIRELGRQKGRDEAMMPYVFTSAIGLLNNTLRGRFNGIGISQTPQVFIDCQAMDYEGGLRVNWDIRKGVFEGNIADDMFSEFERLMEQASGEASLDELKAEMPEYQQAYWNEFNSTDKDIPEKLLYTEFLENAEKAPEKKAVADESRSMTYSQLLRAACGTAKVLEEKGFSKGERAAVLMEKSCEQAIAALAILFAGGVYVPVDSKTESHVRRDKILVQGGIRYALTQTEVSDLPDGITAINVNECGEAGTDVIVQTDTHDAAYIIFTSGTTGEPKGVVIPHCGAYNTIKDLNMRYNIGENDSALGLSEFNFDLSVYDLFGMLSAGGTVYYPQKVGHMNPERWEKLITENNITLWNSVPALMQMFLSDRKLRNSDDPLPIRLVFLSGDWIPVDMPNDIKRNCTSVEVICMGGATEASIWSNYHEAVNGDEQLVSIPYGRPLSNQRFYVVDEQGEICPYLVTGQLHIGGTGVAKGYLNDEKLTDSKFVDEFGRNEKMYATGDMGRMLESGELQFLGRMDDQVKVRGYRIELGEIENALSDTDGIERAVVRICKEKSDLPIQAVAEISKVTESISEAREKEILASLKQIEKAQEQRLVEIKGADYFAEKNAQDNAALLAMIWALQTLSVRTAKEIDESRIIKPEYKWVLKHWLTEIERAGMTEKFLSGTPVTREEAESAWDDARAKWKNSYGSDAILDYYYESAHQLIEVCKGEVDPIGILYPDGKDIYTNSLYVENITASFMTNSIKSIIAEKIKMAGGRKLRILEIGAGTAATAEPVIKSLEGYDYEYHFTDISKYFFKAAAEKFKGNNNVRIYEFDLNKSVSEQGLSENYFDIVIGAYVLNNVNDIQSALRKMEKLAAPNGIVMFSEPLRTIMPLMICQAFLMTKAQDELRKDKTFIDSQQWLAEMERSDSRSKAYLIPSESEILSSLGAGLYVMHVKTEYSEIDREKNDKSLRQQLTEYMIPQAIEYVNELPLTANGKLDRKNAFAGKFASVKVVQQEEISELEKSLKQVWESILGISDLGVTQNLYDFGADSLIMAQSVTKMKNDLHIDIVFDVLLRRLLNYPTIRELAEFIEKNGAEDEQAETEESRALFNIRRHGGNRSDGIRVLIHGALGTTECYQNLIPHLVKQDKGEVITINITDTEAYRQIPSDELMCRLADEYSNAIIAEKPEKVQIIGYSFSGSIAIEIARRLAENDIDISSLIIIDGGTLPVTVAEDIVYEWLFIDSMKICLEDLGFTTEGLLEKAFLHMSGNNKKQLEPENFIEVLENDEDKALYGRLTSMSRNERMNYYCDTMSRKGMAGFNAELLETYCDNFTHSFAALVFLPDLYFGDIRYLSSKEKEGAYGHFDLLLENWKDVCIGEFDWYEIPGDHYSCVEDKKNAAALAGYLLPDEVQEYHEDKYADMSPETLAQQFTVEQIAEAYRISEKMICYVMLEHIQSKGVLGINSENTADEIYNAVNADAKGRKVIARWLRELSDRGYIAENDGKYHALMHITSDMAAEMTAKRSEAWDNVLADRMSGEYLENNIRQLDGLISGKVNANMILFPEGSVDYASALYKSTVIFRYLNRLLADALCSNGAADSIVLEVGAGTGSTTDVVVDVMKKKQMLPKEYIYTDISRFFLNKAAERYDDAPFMRYEVLDLETDIKNIRADHIIANGVLNNVADLKKTLTQLRESLSENGKIYIIEPAKESLEILVSQAFMMSDTEDVRDERNQTFMQDEQWQEMLESVGFKKITAYPEQGKAMDLFGQKLYIAERG